tara:strand:+ start:162 stop:1046 length:885 start_codon:yes stop_codon:yes gene_type:complete
MNKKILITGGSGFIGKNLTLNLLDKNFTIYTVLNNKKQNKELSLKLKKKYKNFKPIFIDNISQIEKKVSKINASIIINLASRYLRNHNFSKMIDLINSNILFSTSVLEAFPKKKLKQFINLSSVMMHKNSEKYLPLNLYAATKKSFLDILKYYETTFKDVKFYNLFLHDIYGENDQRDKIIHTIIRNHKKNKKININSKKLALNLLNVEDVNQAINLIINKKIKSGDYIIKSNKFTNMVDLINKINLKIKKKIKFRVLNKEIEKEIRKKIKLLPYWKQKFTIEKDLIKYLDENN